MTAPSPAESSAGNGHKGWTNRPRTTVTRLLKWFKSHARDLPWRKTQDPYAIWVSEIMLQQTQVKTVIPYWERWMRELPTLQDLAKARQERIHKLWEGLGYYTRVRNLQKAAQGIMREHAGEFPRNFEDVLNLPGIGRYTAGAICSIAFDQPTPILDGNVIRVLTRLEGIEGNPRDRLINEQLWGVAGKLVKEAAAPGRTRNGSRGLSSDFNQALMELGALVCTPRQPGCTHCPLASGCVALGENRVAELPALAPRVATTHRRFAAFVVQRGDRWLVRQRPGGVVNGHLWEFPNVELTGPARDLRQWALQALGFAPSRLERALTLKHSITRYRISLDVFRASLTPAVSTLGWQGRWLRRPQLAGLAFTGSHRKILERVCPD